MFKMCFSEDVAAARAKNAPIVALESTIITHGMPYPQNLETAQMVERTVRDAGAMPATIAVIDGMAHIGLDHDHLKALAQTKDVRKLSRADLGATIALGATGSTTVAATMILAHHAGIKVFATGGIGGVHRGAEINFDISADLAEFTKSPVTVVCAGAKAILDIPKTLEQLETYGVPVITYGADDFPAFWSRISGLPSPLRMNSPDEIAQTHLINATAPFHQGQLIANPIPAEAEIPRNHLEPLIAQAVSEAETQGITAKEVTPFLLNRILELTEGKSLDANIALIKNNARLAAEIAIALKKSD
ncbi:MAG: pseudouridine-5'-phosphate glycosidase [Pseudomonadota bacterium]